MVAFILPFTKPTEHRATTISSFEDELVFRLKAGDKLAIDQLYKKYASSLLGIIVRIVKFDEIAEDVLQETFLKIWKSIGHYDPSRGKLFTWMANLAKNTAIDQIRSKHYTNGIKTFNLAEIPTDTLDHHTYFQLNLDTIGIKQLMFNLKPEHQKILDLFYFEGYTHVEVAKKLNIPLGTVKTRIRQAILTLRQHFNETNRDLNLIGA